MNYTTRDVARVLDLPVESVRRWARSGLLEIERGPRNEYRFSFQDLVLLRTARDLEAAEVPPGRVRAALREVRDQLPDDRTLSSLRVRADGGRVVVDDGRAAWRPETGQLVLDFEVAELAARIAPLEAAGEVNPVPSGERTAEAWFDLACEHEASNPRLAGELYQRALEVDPALADARVNLGRLLHEEGRLTEAREAYERALATTPDHPTAAFNLGVVLEDLGEAEAAVAAYRQALDVDPDLADAHYNLARLHEEGGDRPAALRHLRSYHELVRSGGPRRG